MTPGPPRGASASSSFIVTPEMVNTDEPDGQQVCSLDAMVAAMTRANTDLVTPHLDPGEVVVPDQASFTWRAPVPVGTRLEMVLEVAQVSRASVMADVVVRRDNRMVARGTHTLRVVASGAFASEVAAAD